MPPRPRLHSIPVLRPAYICQQCRCASIAAASGTSAATASSPSATTPAPSLAQLTESPPSLLRFPTTQPPSYKSPDARKTQLHRQYQSLLRSSPLILVFQHNNLKASEWASIRRELDIVLQKADAEHLSRQGTSTAADPPAPSIAANTKLSVVQTSIFASALKVVEFWDPKFPPSASPSTSDELPNGLSKDAWHHSTRAAAHAKRTGENLHGLEPLLSGPLALLTLPSVSPTHLKAALTILAPSRDMPAPRRSAMPSLYEPAVQNGLQKLMLLGARVEGKAFDTEGVKWVGGIAGGIDGLRATLVAMLQGVGAGVTSTLEAASRSLYVTVEGRRVMLEEEGKDHSQGEAGEAKSA